MEKGIAINTILILLVGIMVTGITVYYTYRTFTGSPLSEHECRGMMISWCSSCMMGGAGIDPQLQECASKHWAMTITACDDQAKEYCNAFLPGNGGNGGDGTTTTTISNGGQCSDVGGTCTSVLQCTNILGGTCYSDDFECSWCCCVV